MNTKEELNTRLKEIIRPYVQDEEAFAHMTADTSFTRDLKVNSANLVDIALDVEDAYDIEIDNDAMERMLTVGAAVTIIEEKLEAKQ